MAANFPSTRWSLIARAANTSDAGSHDLMGELLTRYWRPMLVHLHYKGLSNEAAEDITQDFVIELLNRNLLSIADPAKGKFRSLLLTALDHFFVSRMRYENAAKRSPGRLTRLDASQFDQTVDQHDGAALAFERAWALDVLAEALSRMERECADSGETSRWQIFQERIVLPLFSDTPETEYAALAERFDLAGEKAAMNVLVTAKRQFARVLRDVIREYVTRTPTRNHPSQAADQRQPVRESPCDNIDLNEHQVRQAVEREITELQDVLAQSRGVVDLVGELQDDPNPADAAKTRFWRLLTMHDLESNPWSVLFAAGTDIDDITLSAGCEETLQRSLGDIPGCSAAGAETIGQVLRSERPPLAVLRALKGWFNLQRFSPTRDVPAPLANGLYLLVLAVALTRCDARITGLADAQFRAGLEWLAGQQWLADDLRSVVAAAHETLSA